MRRLLLVSLGVLSTSSLGVLGASNALADSTHSGHTMAPAATGATDATDAAEAPAGEAGAAMAALNARMHMAMNVPLTGDPDVDFVRSMIPHHQGAVDMARVVLQHGADPEVRKMAEDVIATQEAEIAWMQDWLAARGQ